MDGELVSTEAAGVGELLVTLRALVGLETCRSTAFSQGKKIHVDRRGVYV